MRLLLRSFELKQTERQLSFRPRPEVDLDQNNNTGTNLNRLNSPTAIQIILICILGSILYFSQKQMNIPLQWIKTKN